MRRGGPARRRGGRAPPRPRPRGPRGCGTPARPRARAGAAAARSARPRSGPAAARSRRRGASAARARGSRRRRARRGTGSPPTARRRAAAARRARPAARRAAAARPTRAARAAATAGPRSRRAGRRRCRCAPRWRPGAAPSRSRGPRRTARGRAARSGARRASYVDHRAAAQRAPRLDQRVHEPRVDPGRDPLRQPPADQPHRVERAGGGAVGGVERARQPELVERERHPAADGAAHPAALDDERHARPGRALAQRGEHGVRHAAQRWACTCARPSTSWTSSCCSGTSTSGGSPSAGAQVLDVRGVARGERRELVRRGGDAAGERVAERVGELGGQLAVDRRRDVDAVHHQPGERQPAVDAACGGSRSPPRPGRGAGR